MITEMWWDWDGERVVVREVEPRDFYAGVPCAVDAAQKRYDEMMALQDYLLRNPLSRTDLARMNIHVPIADQWTWPGMIGVDLGAPPAPTKPKTYGVNTFDRERNLFDPPKVKTGVSHKHWSEK